MDEAIEGNEDTDELLSDNLTFTPKQIEYLRDEFDRQKRWVRALSEREIAALKELNEMRGSFSYRIGRFLTAPIRKIEKIFRKTIHHPFLDEKKLDAFEQDVFSTFLIGPGLLPEKSTYGHPDIFVQELLLSLRRENLSVNEIRDNMKERSIGMGGEVLSDCLKRVTKHAIISREYRPTVNNIFVASIRVLSLVNTQLAREY